MAEHHPHLLHIGLAVIVGVSLIGFVVGTGEDPTYQALVSPQSDDAPSALDAPVAPTYRQLRSAPWATGSGWEADTRSLRGPSIQDAVTWVEGQQVGAIADRAANRAFDGAPPTIPHAVRQDSASECLACHDEGLRLRGRIASPVPHDAFTSCTQCHVVQQAPMPGDRLPQGTSFADNGFVGLTAQTTAPRASAIAPPVIPHRTVMRERCMSCHGTNGRDALRTPHPDRQSCVQCHALSAELNQRPGLADATPWPPGEL